MSDWKHIPLGTKITARDAAIDNALMQATLWVCRFAIVAAAAFVFHKGMTVLFELKGWSYDAPSMKAAAAAFGLSVLVLAHNEKASRVMTTTALVAAAFTLLLTLRLLNAH